MVTDVAFVVVQARVLNWPAVIVAGVAVSVADGCPEGVGVGEGAGVGVGVGPDGEASPTPAQPEKPATKILVKRSARTTTTY